MLNYARLCLVMAELLVCSAETQGGVMRSCWYVCQFVCQSCSLVMQLCRFVISFCLSVCKCNQPISSKLDLMIVPVNLKNWLTFGRDPVSDMDSGPLFPSFTILDFRFISICHNYHVRA